MITFQVLAGRAGWQLAQDGRIIGPPVDEQEHILIAAYEFARNHPEDDTTVEVHTADGLVRRLAYYPKVG